MNSANEKLEQLYLQKTFSALLLNPENPATVKEGTWNGNNKAFTLPPSVNSNRRVCDLLTKRPGGIIPLVDDECKFPKVINKKKTFFLIIHFFCFF